MLLFCLGLYPSLPFEILLLRLLSMRYNVRYARRENFRLAAAAAEFYVQPPPPKKIRLSRISRLAAEIFT